MIYTLSDIMANKALIAISLVSLTAIFFIYRAPGLARMVGPRSPFRWSHFAVYTVFIVAEYFILGPYSYISPAADLPLSADLILSAHAAAGSLFSHAVGGGADLALLAPGQQHFQPEIVLARIFPVWIWLLVHKVMVTALGLWGGWLLAGKALPGRPMTAAVAAMSLPYAHPYLFDFSVEFGTGFAVIPLAVYVLLADVAHRLFWWRALGTAVLVAFAFPMKVFPALGVTVAAGAILFGLGNWRRTVLGLALMAVASVLNWHEVITNLMVASGAISRSARSLSGLTDAVGAAIGLFTDCPVPSVILVVSLVVLAATDRRRAVRLAAASAWVAVAFLVLTLAPFDRIGLGFVSLMRHIYIRLALPTIAVVGLSWGFAALPDGRRLVRASAAVFIALAVWVKLVHGGELLWFGGQSPLFNISTLAKPDWHAPGDWRAITLVSPHPNVPGTVYGVETFDARYNLTPASYLRYWEAVNKWAPAYSLLTHTRVDWSLWDGHAYHMERSLNFDLLRAANVRYLLSALPLAEGTGAHLISQPLSADRRFGKVRPEFFPSMGAYLAFQVHNLFEPAELWVYEFDGVTPRVWTANAVVVADEEEHRFFDQVARHVGDRIVVVKASDAAKLGQGPVPQSVVEDYRKVENGYDISVTAPEGGLLVVNNYFMPFWRAEADGQPMDIIPVNGAQMALVLPANARTIRLRYAYPSPFRHLGYIATQRGLG